MSLETPLSLPQGILKTDQDGPVSLYCYKSKNIDKEEMKQCRGLVYCNDTLVFRGRPFVQEYTLNEIDSIPTLHVSDYRFFCWKEGTLLRLVFVNDKWYITTHRRLDAFKSKWGTDISFGELFERSLPCSLPDFLWKLDTAKQYVFLLQSSSLNRRVCKANETPMIFHLDTFISLTETDPQDDIGLPRLKEEFPETIKEAFEIVEQQDPVDIQGLLVVSKSSLDHFRLISTRFAYYNSVRGNHSDIMIRFIELVQQNTKKELDTLLLMNPERENEFCQLRDRLTLLVRTIHSEYIQRYVRKQFILLHPSIHFILKKCHSRYIETRRIIRESDVKEVLFALDAPHILRLSWLHYNQIYPIFSSSF
jgi:hypothetical protein